MPTFEVGQLYHPEHKKWPECSQFNFRGGHLELVLFFGSPSPAEVEDVRKGEAEFALFTHGSVIVFLYRLGREIGWSDAPYSWHLVPKDEQVLPPAEGEIPNTLGLALHVFLVDAATGVLKAIRQLGLATHFSRALAKAIREQAAQPWNAQAYDQALNRIYAKHKTTASLFAQSTVRCKVGQ